MNGEIGTALLPDEQKQSNLYKDVFLYRYEQMRLQFEAYKRNIDELEGGEGAAKTMEEYFNQMMEKYQENLLLMVSNQK